MRDLVASYPMDAQRESHDPLDLDEPKGSELRRFLGSAVVALLTLAAILYGMAKAVGPGSPGSLYIIGKLELMMTPSAPDAADER